MEYALKLGQSVLLEVGPDMLGAETNAALEHLLLRMFKTSGRGNERTVQILSKGGTAKSVDVNDAFSIQSSVKPYMYARGIEENGLCHT